MAATVDDLGSPNKPLKVVPSLISDGVPCEIVHIADDMMSVLEFGPEAARP